MFVTNQFYLNHEERIRPRPLGTLLTTPKLTRVYVLMKLTGKYAVRNKPKIQT